MNACCENPRYTAEHDRFEDLVKKHEAETLHELMEQDAKIAELVCKFGNSFEAAFASYIRSMMQNGQLPGIVTDAVNNKMTTLDNRTSGMVNVKEFGAVGNGVWDDTEAIQKAVNHANMTGRKVHVPAGNYLISAPIILDGCSMIGEPGNIYNPSGTVFTCYTKDFKAIRQGSTAVQNCMFTISDITVKDADFAFEIVYAINSKFERLYALDCNTGFEIGDRSAVGCMFCEFNNFFAKGCNYGMEIFSSEYMNNNRFNNGYLEAMQVAMKMRVDGGYGAVGNVFNNVEFRSQTGRGAELTSCINTVFNSCYFENAGNSIRLLNYCSITLNECTYGLYKNLNNWADYETIYADGGGALTINGGVIFLDEEYNNKYFFACTNEAVFQNIVVLKNIMKNGGATNFKFFQKAVAFHEQTATTGTVTIPADGIGEVSFTFETPFASVPAIMTATMRGAAGAERGLSFCLSERTAEGGKISISNTSTGQRSVSFSVYAKSGV